MLATAPSPLVSRSPSAPEAPLLRAEDLHDPGRFHHVRRVPLIDQHTAEPDDDRGDVDQETLEKLARNSNERVEQHNPPVLKAGHTLRKSTVIIEKDGKRIIAPGADEQAQPKILGFASNFNVDEYMGKPCLFGDLHIFHDKLADAKELPFRSVERLLPEEYLDTVSLLRSPPQRDLGYLLYQQDDALHLRLSYSRFADDPSTPEFDSIPITSTVTEDTMPETTTATAAAPVGGGIDYEQLATALAAKLGPSLSQSLGQEMPNHLNSALQPYFPAEAAGLPPAEGEAPAEDELPTEEETADGRTSYMAEASGDNTFVPGSNGNGQASGRTTREIEDQFRHQYARSEKRFSDLENSVAFLLEELEKSQRNERRLRYEQQLTGLIDREGYEFDLAEELAAFADDQPAPPQGYEDQALKKIRNNYRKRSTGRSFLPTAGPDLKAAKPGITAENHQQVINYITRHQCDVQTAKQALGLV
jgi:hypothetical protein